MKAPFDIDDIDWMQFWLDVLAGLVVLTIAAIAAWVAGIF